jgi:CRISPR-associated protein Csx10
MDIWAIEFELISETIFGSGESVPGSVDSEIVHDELGLPYYKSKTFKGRLREEIENIALLAGTLNKSTNYSEKVRDMFGDNTSHTYETIKFSDCTFKPNVIKAINYGISNKMFSKEEVLNSLTEVRYSTSIDENGISMDGSLRSFRVINDGMKFLTKLDFTRQVTDEELELLSAGVASLRHIGTKVSKGKGEIKAVLLCNGKDVTSKYLDSFTKRVNSND